MSCHQWIFFLPIFLVFFYRREKKCPSNFEFVKYDKCRFPNLDFVSSCWCKGQPQASNVQGLYKVSLIRSAGKQESCQKMDVAGAGGVFTVGVAKKMCHDSRKTAEYK